LGSLLILAMLSLGLIFPRIRPLRFARLWPWAFRIGSILFLFVSIRTSIKLESPLMIMSKLHRK
jgi:hypothetical protein